MVDVYCIPSCHPPWNHRKLWIHLDENPIADIVPARIRCLHRALDQVDEKAGKVRMVWRCVAGPSEKSSPTVQVQSHGKEWKISRKSATLVTPILRNPDCSLSPAAIIGLVSQVFSQDALHFFCTPPRLMVKSPILVDETRETMKQLSQIPGLCKVPGDLGHLKQSNVVSVENISSFSTNPWDIWRFG